MFGLDNLVATFSSKLKQERLAKLQTYKEKIEYVETVIIPGLTESFKKGDKYFTGNSKFDSDLCTQRSDAEDVRHVRDLHCNVRLLEAEDAAEHFDNEKALKKIESAIGYLCILHMRIVAGLPIEEKENDQ